jgi:hypothetical protein
LPMPGSPVTVSSVPRPARVAASAESTSARTRRAPRAGSALPDHPLLIPPVSQIGPVPRKPAARREPSPFGMKILYRPGRLGA